VDLWATEQTLHIADREDTPALLVLNRVPARAALTAEMQAVISQNAFPLAATFVGNRIAYASSMGQGRTVVETEPSGKASGEIAALTEEILKIIRGD
jgi:chromosome partitioning protein